MPIMLPPPLPLFHVFFHADVDATDIFSVDLFYEPDVQSQGSETLESNDGGARGASKIQRYLPRRIQPKPTRNSSYSIRVATFLALWL